MSQLVIAATGACTRPGGVSEVDRQAVARLIASRCGELGFDESPLIEHRSTGQPYIAGSDAQISISHDMGCPVVATAAFPIGVDLQHLCEVSHSFQRRLQQCTDGGTTPMTPSEAIQSWVARESISKCRGTGLRDKPWQYRLTAGGSGQYEECYWATKFLPEHGAWLGVASLFGPVALILNGARFEY